MSYAKGIFASHGSPVVADEVALIQAARIDPTVFGTLYQQYVDRIYWYVRARTGCEEDASDLTQEVFIRALEALPRYQERKIPFSAWLFRIARNAAIDFARRRRAPAAWCHLPQPDLVGDTADVESIVLDAEVVAELHTLVSKLDDDKRELLALRFGVRLTSAEIAVVIGKSEAATKKQLSRLLRTLKEQYRGQTQ